MAPRLDVDFPLRLDAGGRTATTGRNDHVRDLVEQVLLTAPGERVNRPGFGCGLAQLVFLPNSEPLAAATRAAVHGALSTQLGDLLDVRSVDVVATDAVLEVTVQYALRGSGDVRTETFRRTP
jgi:phage baseplate assembly protein W